MEITNVNAPTTILHSTLIPPQYLILYKQLIDMVKDYKKADAGEREKLMQLHQK